ncbi:ABC-type transport auxiliary lipoprotein family protein [Mesorhizobium sp. BR1-1-16]|uniref:ABC-type transport auxiliary lipoprotein family protein n=1 Tax=Mesorhizobium sp. BR1-1-16 TaxID=2876653 RepID=UPI001CCB9EEA|nr:ABC-type transport auxiliary lipoprotein family protein [Mesorhizobium sp. BR1-1-16]MBZ9935409.1 ABC-type transport auxiliary lipoprotein family protein [Mesorhizobium sp. BR1-1-16]
MKRSLPYGAVMTVALAMLLAGCVSKLVTAPPPNTYDIAGPTNLPKVGGAGSAQILVPAPSALQILATQRIVVSRGALMAYYPNAQYPDTLPNVLQARIIETFERSKQAHAVGRPGEGLSIDYQLLTDIRSFNVVVGPAGLVAEVEISARILNDRNGRIVDFKVFKATAPVAADTAPEAIAGLSAALDIVLVDLARWVLVKL